MFFSLVRSNVTEEEKAKIFSKDKRLTAKRSRDTKRRQLRARQARRERETQERGAQRELERFRRELGQSSDGCSVVCGSGCHPPDRNMDKRWRRERRDLVEEERYVDLDDPSNECTEEGEIVEGWRSRGGSEGCGKGSVFERLGRQAEGREGKEEEGEEEGELEEMEMESSVVDVRAAVAQQLQGSSEESGGREGRRGGVGGRERGEAVHGNSLEERIAAEQFESMTEWDLDFGIELNYS